LENQIKLRTNSIKEITPGEGNPTISEFRSSIFGKDNNAIMNTPAPENSEFALGAENAPYDPSENIIFNADSPASFGKYKNLIIKPFEKSVNDTVLDRSAAKIFSPEGRLKISRVSDVKPIEEEKKSEQKKNSDDSDNDVRKQSAMKKLMKHHMKKNIVHKNNDDTIIKFVSKKKKEKIIESDTVTRITKKSIRPKSMNEISYQERVIQRFASIALKDFEKTSNDDNKSELFTSFNYNRSPMTKKMEELNRDLVNDKIMEKNFKFSHYYKDYEQQEAWQMYSTLLFAEVKDEYRYENPEEKNKRKKKK
jgi:hypothetical protein